MITAATRSGYTGGDTYGNRVCMRGALRSSSNDEDDDDEDEAVSDGERLRCLLLRGIASVVTSTRGCVCGVLL